MVYLTTVVRFNWGIIDKLSTFRVVHKETHD